jgi:hypothetical protein
MIFQMTVSESSSTVHRTRRSQRLRNLVEMAVATRPENSYQPTRRRERIMKRFKSPQQLQRFLSTHDPIANLFTRRPSHDTAAKLHCADTIGGTWRRCVLRHPFGGRSDCLDFRLGARPSASGFRSSYRGQQKAEFNARFCLDPA